VPNQPPLPPKPPTKAAALHYAEGSQAAPKLVAKGVGPIAEKIIALAKEHDIPFHSDADLIEILEKIEIDTEIPLEVYAIVAEIFAYLYRTNQAKRPAAER
jgi:flagellar biosynthesis protein